MEPTKETDRDDHRRADFEPHERATLREVMEAFLRSRWLRKTIRSILAWTTAILVVIGLFRENISAAIEALTGPVS